MLSTDRVRLPFGSLLLAQRCFPFCLLGYVFLVRLDPANRSLLTESRNDVRVTSLLFWRDLLPPNVLVIVLSSTCGAQAVHGSLDVVVAELAYLTTNINISKFEIEQEVVRT